jgi:hypothetical protein
MPYQTHVLHRVIVVVICLGVGGLHFVTGPSYDGPFPAFVNGYLIDLLLPFAMYLLLGIQEFEVFRGRTTRLVLVFGVGFVTETLQYFGVPLFGRTFDPLDYLMFAAGIGGAIVFEWAVFSRIAKEPAPRGFVMSRRR